MKFIVESLTKCRPRLGTLIELHKSPLCSIETPMAMLYTRGGSLPHITYEVFKLICIDPQIIQIPIVSTYHFQDVLMDFEGNINDFVGLEDCTTCVTVQDPGDLTQPGHHFKGHIPIWTRSGKVLLNPTTYMDTIESFKPNMYYFLSDGDTNLKSPSKRITKSVDNTITFYKQCLERHRQSKILENTFPMATIAGGYNFRARKDCIDAVSKDDEIQGFLIDGLHNNGPEVEFIPFEETKAVVEYVVNNLPEKKLRSIQGCWNPMVIIKLIQLGIDVFDTSYCNLVTERSSALVFAFDEENFYDEHPYEINLRQSKFVDDFTSLVEGCECLSCTKHTRSYIHHLVTVQELLGPVLLTIHNNYHFLKYFKKIREAIKYDKIKDLEQLIEKQFLSHQRNIMIPRKDVIVGDTA